MSFNQVHRLVDGARSVDVRMHNCGHQASIAIVDPNSDPSSQTAWEIEMSVEEAARVAELLTKAVSLAWFLKAGGRLRTWDEVDIGEMLDRKQEASARRSKSAVAR